MPRMLSSKQALMASGLLAALCLCTPSGPAFAQDTATGDAAAEDTAETTDDKTAAPEAPPAPACTRTTLTGAITLARAAIDAKHAAAKDAKKKSKVDDPAPPHVVDVLWAELAINAVPRYYDLIMFDTDRNYLVRIDEASARILNLTRPGEGRDEDISHEAEALYDTSHVRMEEVIAGAQDARPRGIPIAARLNAIYGAQPVYEVVMRMPPGNDEVLLVDGLSGNAIEMENFQ